MADTQLSPHFWLSEFTTSQTAIRAGISNDPASLDDLNNLIATANLLERVRNDVLGGKSIHVNSAYRGPAVNKLVGGVSTSAHCTGRAVDFTCAGFGTPKEVCQAIVAAKIPFDQLIYEGTWVHMGIAEPGKAPREQVLTAVFKPGQPTRYVPGVVDPA